MRRSEPKIGDVALAALDANTRIKVARKLGSAETPGARFASWVITGLILALVFVGLPWGAFYLGVIGHMKGASLFAPVPSSLVIGGLGLVWVIQLAGTAFLFSRSVVKGVLSFLVPGYWFFALGREPARWPFAGFTLLGLFMYAAGAFLASSNAL